MPVHPIAPSPPHQHYHAIHDCAYTLRKAHRSPDDQPQSPPIPQVLIPKHILRRHRGSREREIDAPKCGLCALEAEVGVWMQGVREPERDLDGWEEDDDDYEGEVGDPCAAEVGCQWRDVFEAGEEAFTLVYADFPTRQSARA